MTILGRHTVNEARDLLAAADYRFRETFKAFDALKDKPADLTTDVGNLARTWKSERVNIILDLTKLTTTAQLAAGMIPVSADIIPAEDDYQKILSFVQYGENTKGSLQDVTHRIEKLSGKQILYPNQPKQDSPDLDLETYKDLDSAIKQGEDAASKGVDKLEKVAENKWPWIIGGTVAATLVGMHYLKKL